MPMSQLAKGGRAAVLALLVLGGAVFLFQNRGVAGGEIFTDGNNVAILGYDTVAYFTEKRAVKGSEAHSHRWQGAVWHFASAGNRDLFAANPRRYAPQYGGY